MKGDEYVCGGGSPDLRSHLVSQVGRARVEDASVWTENTYMHMRCLAVRRSLRRSFWRTFVFAANWLYG